MYRLMYYGDEVLTQPASPFDFEEGSVEELTGAMRQLMEDFRGHGIAAPQVGVSKRVFLLKRNSGEVQAYFNPEITFAQGEQMSVEGCLSIPGARAQVKRPHVLTLRYQNNEGDVCEDTFAGIEAVVVSHEVDHLDGILFLDRVSKFKRSRALQQHQKLLKKLARLRGG